jgi:hypothetical protein
MGNPLGSPALNAVFKGSGLLHTVSTAEKSHFQSRERMSKVISMTDYVPGDASRLSGIRDRRYTIRFPFAADAEMIDMESGKQVTGVTSDISLGGCFICTGQSFRVNTRARLRLERKGKILDALVIVRIVKARVGLGVEFFDLEDSSARLLSEWIESLRRSR